MVGGVGCGTASLWITGVDFGPSGADFDAAEAAAGTTGGTVVSGLDGVFSCLGGWVGAWA